MPLKLVFHVHFNQNLVPISKPQIHSYHLPSCFSPTNLAVKLKNRTIQSRTQANRLRNQCQRSFKSSAISASLDLTEDNIKQVLTDARTELAQLFDTSVNITGKVELVELDGPYVTISLTGRFWHKRSTVLARLGNYLKQRIPEILEVDVEDEKQLDDSPANF